MSKIARLPGSVPDLSLPLPAGAGLPQVNTTIGQLKALLARSTRVVEDLRQRLTTEALQLPDGFDPEAVADEWHARYAEPLLVEHPFLGTVYSDALSEFHEGCRLVSGVLSDWVNVTEQLSVIAHRHDDLVDQLQRITGHASEAELARRMEVAKS